MRTPRPFCSNVGGNLGALAGIAADLGLGKVLDKSGPRGYFYAFLIAGLLYPIALLAIHVIMPRMTPLDENLEPVKKP